MSVLVSLKTVVTHLKRTHFSSSIIFIFQKNCNGTAGIDSDVDF